MINTTTPPNRSLFAIGTGIALAVLIALSVYLSINNRRLEGKITALTSKKDALIAAQKSTDATEARGSALAIKLKLDELKKNSTAWSDVVKKIDHAIPRLEKSETPIINVRSYTGSEQGDIAITAVTRADSFDAFADLALALRQLVAEPAFKKVFVPAITRTLTPEGAIVLNFSINFHYEKPKS